MNAGSIAAEEIRVIRQVVRPGVEHGEVRARGGVELADERLDRALAGRQGQRIVVGEEAAAEPAQDDHIVAPLIDADDVGNVVAARRRRRWSRPARRRREAGGRPPGSQFAPCPTPMKMLRSLEPALATIRSGIPLPVKSATVRPTGSVPVKKRRGASKLIPAQPEVDEDVVLAPC